MQKPTRTTPDPDVTARAVFSELARIAEALGIPVIRSSAPREQHRADGLFVRKTTRAAAHIVIDDALTILTAVKALAHELAHAVLHAGPQTISEAQQEIEAEVVAFALLRVMGIDTLRSSLDYIRQWAHCDEDVSRTQPRVAEACGLILARRHPRAF